MELKIKKLAENAVLPVRAHESDAGFDLTCTRITTTINECGQLMLVYHTDIAMEIPEGCVGLLFPRSSIYKKSLRQTNAVGILDACFRGEVRVVMATTTDVLPAVYKEGERFCQLVIVELPKIEVTEAEELSQSDRGEDGFGSTGTDINEEVSAPSATQSLPETEAEATNSEPATEVAAGENTPEQAQ